MMFFDKEGDEISFSSDKAAVAYGNGVNADEISFAVHCHPETEHSIHRSWSDCRYSYCTWAGVKPWRQRDYIAGSPAWERTQQNIEEWEAMMARD